MNTEIKANYYFFIIGSLGYAKNYSKGWKTHRETALSVHLPRDGKWKKLFWRFYWRTDKKGYKE